MKSPHHDDSDSFYKNKKIKKYRIILNIVYIISYFFLEAILFSS